MSTRDNEMDRLEQKFEDFFLLYFPKVKRFAYELLKSDSDAEDIAQDIFVKLWSMPHLWAEAEALNSIDGYLFTMVKNHVLNAIKRKMIEKDYREKNNRDYDFTEIIDTENPLTQLYYKEIQLLIQLSLEQMPEKRCQVFKMSRFEEKSNVEIARQLNLSVRTVEHHIYLALSELKKMLIAAFFLLSL